MFARVVVFADHKHFEGLGQRKLAAHNAAGRGLDRAAFDGEARSAATADVCIALGEASLSVSGALISGSVRKVTSLLSKRLGGMARMRSMRPA